jgi:hypothetical protein
VGVVNDGGAGGELNEKPTVTNHIGRVLDFPIGVAQKDFGGGHLANAGELVAEILHGLTDERKHYSKLAAFARDAIQCAFSMRGSRFCGSIDPLPRKKLSFINKDEQPWTLRLGGVARFEGGIENPSSQGTACRIV